MAGEEHFEKLRIWHVINVPRELFTFEVGSVPMAIAVLKAIALYDLFLGDGEDKPWTTVGGRENEIKRLTKESVFPHVVRRAFIKYAEYLDDHCPGGVPLVVCNAQGCEVFEDGEWCEYYNDDGYDVRELSDQVEEEKTANLPLNAG